MDRDCRQPRTLRMAQLPDNTSPGDDARASPPCISAWFVHLPGVFLGSDPGGLFHESIFLRLPAFILL